MHIIGKIYLITLVCGYKVPLYLKKVNRDKILKEINMLWTNFWIFLFIGLIKKFSKLFDDF